jgi:hypothetical protein
MALASALCTPEGAQVCCEQTNLYSSAWSYRTGKRIGSSLEKKNERQLTMRHKFKRPALK